MATDPIQRVKELDQESPLSLDLRRTLRKLAELPPSRNVPYLTACLDWRPEGTSPGREPPEEPRPSERRSGPAEPGPSRRPARQELEQALSILVDGFGPRGDAFESLTGDVAQIYDFLDDELDPAAQGASIIASHANGVFVPLALGVPLETAISAGPIPSLTQLAKVNDDHPLYAVLNADQKEAVLGLYSQAHLDWSMLVEGSGYPRKQQQGGWSQRRYQARADERVSAFAKGVAEETRRVLDEEEISMLVVAGDEVITSALDDEFHQTVKDRIIGQLRLNNNMAANEIGDAAEPLVAAEQRRREDESVSRMLNGLGEDGLGAAGVKQVLPALQAGQVMTLIMNDDFSAEAWADFDLQVYGPGGIPKKHPAGGDPESLTAVKMEDLLVWLALQTGAGVQIIHTEGALSAEERAEIPDAGEAPPRSKPATVMDQYNGVGALLRYA